MNLFKFKVLSVAMILVAQIVPQAALAMATPEVKASIYHDACGYYSATYADLHVRYVGPLESGAKVFIKYSSIGYRFNYNERGEAYQVPFGWNDIKEIPMPATGPGVREADLRVAIRARSYDFTANKLGFVFHIVMPNGEYYDNGFQSQWGSYEVEFPLAGIECLQNRDQLPAAIELPITIHNK